MQKRERKNIDKPDEAPKSIDKPDEASTDSQIEIPNQTLWQLNYQLLELNGLQNTEYQQHKN